MQKYKIALVSVRFPHIRCPIETYVPLGVVEAESPIDACWMGRDLLDMGHRENVRFGNRTETVRLNGLTFKLERVQ